LTPDCRNHQAGAKPFAEGIVLARGKSPIPKGTPQQMYAVCSASAASLQCPVVHVNLTRRYQINTSERLSVQERISDPLPCPIGRSTLALIPGFEAELILERKAL